MKKEPIRIAQIIGKWVGGGVEAVVMNYYRHIDKSKIQFDFICDDDSTNIPYEEIEKLGGRVILIPPYQKVFKYHKELKKILKEGNYRIVHSHINTLSVFSLFAAKCAGVPVRIAHSHSTTNKKEKKKNLLKQVLRPFSKIFATDYMCCSELAGRWLFGDKEYDKGNVYLLNNAIDLDKFKFNDKVRKEKRKELGISDDTIIIGHIGRFVEQKNHRFLIDIFNEFHKKNSNSILLLAGQGPLMEEMKDKVGSLNISDSVYFLGQRKDVSELYQAFDVFLLPSLYEGLPVVGVEAQASGNLCYLSSDMTKETKVLDSTVFMSLDNTAEEWAKAILKDVKKYKKHDTKEEVSNYGFNIEKEVEKLEGCYENMLDDDKKIVVLHLISTTVFSGAENVACQIINSFRDDKNVDMYYTTVLGKNVEILDDKKIKYIELKKFNFRYIKKVVKQFKPDIIHAHDIRASFYASFFHKNVKVISHVHNNHEDMRKIGIKTILYNFVSKRFKKIIWVSKSAFDSYYYKKNVLGKSVILYNAIDTEEIEEKVLKDDKNYNYDVIFLGRLTYQKNPERLIEIAKNVVTLHPKFKMAIVGSGELEHIIIEMINKYDLNDNVDVLGFMNNPYKILKQSKILILTSRFEGTPMVALESMALGVPIVSTYTDGMIDIIEKGKNGFLCNTNDEFIDIINSIVFDEKKLLNLKKTTIKISDKINSMDNYQNVLRDIYDIKKGE